MRTIKMFVQKNEVHGNMFLYIESFVAKEKALNTMPSFIC